MKKLIVFTFFAVCSFLVSGQTAFFEIDSLIKKSLPEASEVGIYVYDLSANQPLYGYRQEKLSRPASTMKLLTAITALSRPEGHLPFRTEVWTNGVIENNTLKGDLYLVGGFDPEFDDRAMNTLVQQVVDRKIKVVKGRLYADVSMKDSLYWGSGWAWDDTPEAYQPYLSPLMFCKGVLKVVATPSPTGGEAARLFCTPHSLYYTLTNRTKTRRVSEGPFSVSRGWLKNTNDIVVSGNVERRTIGFVNVYSSADFFTYVFAERLRDKGVQLRSTYGYGEFQKEKQALCLSAVETPVQLVINQLMKESDNLNGQALICRLGAQASGKKRVSDQVGLAEINRLIKQLGHRPEEYRLADGCGLSNYNYLTPELLVDFLKHAYSQKEIYEKLYPSLPIGGVDGTLKNRMKGASYKKVHAKTGSFTAINTLAGYVTLANGHLAAFAIMNQNMLSAKQARQFQDRVCDVLCR